MKKLTHAEKDVIIANLQKATKEVVIDPQLLERYKRQELLIDSLKGIISANDKLLKTNADFLENKTKSIGILNSIIENKDQIIDNLEQNAKFNEEEKFRIIGIIAFVCFAVGVLVTVAWKTLL